MPKKKETRPAAGKHSGRASKSTRRLSQSEWEREWDKYGPWLVAVFAAASLFVTLVETGVIL